jgi:hypothetical protein
MSAIDQLGVTNMEIDVLNHQASLTKDEHTRNEALSSKDAVRNPLQVQYIGVSYFSIR